MRIFMLWFVLLWLYDRFFLLMYHCDINLTESNRIVVLWISAKVNPTTLYLLKLILLTWLNFNPNTDK